MMDGEAQAPAPVVTLTLDTCVINARQCDDAMNELERLHASGRILLVKGDPMDTELQGHYSPGLLKSARYSEDIGALVLGYSRLDHTRLASSNPPEVDETLPVAEMSDVGRFRAVAEVLCPGRAWENLAPHMMDVMHLATHAGHRRDVFVTNDGDFFHAEPALQDRAKQQTLRERFGLLVMTPDEALAYVRRRLAAADFAEVAPS